MVVTTGSGAAGGGGMIWTPTFIDPADTFSILEDKQVLFSLPIDAEGTIDGAGTLVWVG